MNPYELADELDKYKGIVTRDAATMLRQQQAEIKVLKDSSYEKGFIDGMAQMTKSAVHRAVESMAVKELTDEEIYQLAEYYGVNNSGTLDFARAILRKAQER